MTRTRTLAMVLAGGSGSRMGALTDTRAKPALPFAGVYRLVDFPLSNCSNSGMEDVWVVQQYEPYSLEGHLSNGRPWDLDRTTGGLLILHPFTGSDGEGFPEGNADALWRHHRLITEFDPDVVLALSADAVYTFDYRDLVDTHVAAGADVTMATTRVEEHPGRFGVVTTGEDRRVQDFEYKPSEPKSDVVTMEIFAYRPSALLGTLRELAQEGEERSDFGHELLPRLVSDGRAFEHRFHGYWRDLGTTEAYWEAHQDLLQGNGLDLHDPRWPIRTKSGHKPPAHVARGGSVDDSLVSPACKVSGRVIHSVLCTGVVVEEGAVVDHAVVLDGAVIRSGAHVERAIVDAGVDVPANTEVRGGDDPENPIAVVADPR
ncbi:MAG: glucose-1-phosphate adenylyltransferase [Actinomycetota bacterium]|nr:glucose-1-phosphate adenylyltransferase [Actinomycetota bacterium]